MSSASRHHQAPATSYLARLVAVPEPGRSTQESDDAPLPRGPRSPFTPDRVADETPACLGHSRPEIFAPYDHASLEEAISTCLGCPVRADCETKGIRNREWGVWGGVLMRNGRPAERFTRDKESWLADNDEERHAVAQGAIRTDDTGAA